MLRCPIPECFLHKIPRLSDLVFLKTHLLQKHSYKERIKVALILECQNYTDGNSHLDYLTSQGIVEA